MADDTCASFLQLWQSLENQIQRLRDSIPELEAEGIKTDPIVRMIGTLQTEAAAEYQAYLRCLRRGNVHIEGIEQTQTIQYWNYPPGQGSGFALPNSIPLISRKTTILRVYVDVTSHTAGLPLPAKVLGQLTVTGPAAQAKIDPFGGSITGKSVSNIKRGQIADTLNFVIPASYCVGTLQCSLHVFDPQNAANSDVNTFGLTFLNANPLRVHGVLVHYTGVDFFNKPVDAQPSGWDLLGSLDSSNIPNLGRFL
jgi:hypothetical protein